MTIELVTGTPGAGKTCYVVAKRIMEESGRQIAVDRIGAPGQVDLVERRIIVAGINGLVCLHEKLPHTLTGERVGASDIAKWNEADETGEPLYKRLPGEPPWTNVQQLGVDGKPVPFECTIFNWWLWCQPGDLIVCDEVQFIIPRGTLGKTPPHYIKSLEIHRHYGVDFIFITQSPTLIDTTIRNLVGLHRHVRSLMNSPLCALYEWDHASNTERISLSSKRLYWRRRAYFKLYRSTVAVVAPPSSGRAPLFIVPILLALVLFSGSRMFEKFRPKPSTPAGAAMAAGTAQNGSGPPNGWKLDPVLGLVPAARLQGCYAVGSTCKCFDEKWTPISVTLQLCQKSASSFDGLVKWEPSKPPAAAGAYGASAGPSPSGKPASASST